MDALDRFDAALRAMKQAVLDVRCRPACRTEDADSATAALAMLEMMGRRVRWRGLGGSVTAPQGTDWRERQLRAGDR